ncbi:MAG: Jag N-terminal domain-containing protein [Deltaproteobacteria bacterium]|jgi:spoIIIJ-associated protein|nr:Jag N-terminal domain-containing protein [Deltaproteobacteria bacterium]
MSPVLEFESKSVEEAVQEASQKLNIPPNKLAHDIISYGSTGIFGLVGSKKAKIRVVVPDDAVSKTVDVSPGMHQGNDGEVASIVEEAFGKVSASDEPQEATDLGKEALQRIVDFISTDAVVSATHGDGKLVFEVTGGNPAVLIGKRGQTLEAMQYLVEKIINKQNEQRIRVEVDVEGYLQAQRERLQKLALRLGEKVKKTGKPVTAGQFNAHDRRIIHIALKEDREVRTHSVGEGYYRKLKIYPKRKRRKNPS